MMATARPNAVATKRFGDSRSDDRKPAGAGYRHTFEGANDANNRT